MNARPCEFANAGLETIQGGEVMEETSLPRRGPIEGTSRVVRELLRTPRFKKTVNILLSELDPENTGLLVKTLMWEDPELFLSLFGATPDIANVAINGLLELSRQLSNFPPGLLASFLSVLMEGLEMESLGTAVGKVRDLLVEVRDSGGQPLVDSLTDLLRRFARGATGFTPVSGAPSVSADKVVDSVLPVLASAAARFGGEAAREGSETSAAVKKLADGVRDIASRNPEFMKSVVAPLVEAGKAALAGTDAGEGS